MKILRKIEEGLSNFYLEADKDTIKEILYEDIVNIKEYEKKKRKLLTKIKNKQK